MNTPLRAKPPQQPPLGPKARAGVLEANERAASRRQREQRSLLRGLLWLTALIVIGSILRAGFERAFVPGWWRQW